MSGSSWPHSLARVSEPTAPADRADGHLSANVRPLSPLSWPAAATPPSVTACVAVAAVAAVSLTATCGYLAVVWATAGLFGDVLVRDVGLAGLAWAVPVEALRRPG